MFAAVSNHSSAQELLLGRPSIQPSNELLVL
jgi:hypothetical protein